MAEFEDVQSASQFAAENGGMSYGQWASANSHPARKLIIGLIVGLAIGGLLGLAWPAYAIALAVGGAVAGAAGGVMHARASARSPKMAMSYLNYVNSAEAMQGRAQQLSQEAGIESGMEPREGENVARLRAEEQAAATGITR